MIKRKHSSATVVAALTALLSLGCGLSFAASNDAAKPASEHLAAKKEMVRKQQEQRVTNEKRKTAAEALKTERLKVYNARQAAQKSSPQNFETK